MYEVNRSVAVLKPRQAFLDWLLQLPGNLEGGLQLEELRRDCNALLIPAADDYASAQDFVHHHYRTLFGAELADWCDDDAFWPELTPQLFLQWFDVEIHSVLTDLVDFPLEREPFVPFDLDQE